RGQWVVADHCRRREQEAVARGVTDVRATDALRDVSGVAEIRALVGLNDRDPHPQGRDHVYDERGDRQTADDVPGAMFRPVGAAEIHSGDATALRYSGIV